MEKYLKITEKICEISYQIFYIYEKMISLDNEGQTDSDEFWKLKIKLNFLKIEENRLYEAFKLNPQMAVTILNVFVEKLPSVFPCMPIAVLDGDREDLIRYRIITKFKRICRLYEPYLKEECATDLSTISLNGMKPDIIRKDLAILYDKTEECANIYYASLFENHLGFDFDDLPEDILFLTENKYYYSFLEPKIEDYYLDTDFTKRLPLKYSDILKEDFNMAPSDIFSILNGFGLDYCYGALLEILAYHDEDLEEDYKRKDIQFLLNIFKTGMIFIIKDGYNKLDYLIEEMFEDEEYLEEHENDIIIRRLISTTVSNINEYQKYSNEDNKQKTI